ncbi:MAG: hypothetical protein ABIJ30_05185, partial [bacterium]
MNLHYYFLTIVYWQGQAAATLRSFIGRDKPCSYIAIVYWQGQAAATLRSFIGRDKPCSYIAIVYWQGQALQLHCDRLLAGT